MLWTRNGSSVPTVAGASVNRLSSLFDDFFAPLAIPQAVLPLSLWEDEHNIYVEMDLPGMNEKDIELSIHDGSLVIAGERKCERKEGGYDSRRYGRFEQRVTLPALVDAGKVEAKLAAGVLRVTLPKSEEARPRKIAVKTE